MKRTKRQLTIEALGRLIDSADQIAEVLTGHDDALAREVQIVRGQLRNRQRKLEVKEGK